MKKEPLVYLKSREKIRLKKIMMLKADMSYKDYLKTESIFLNDYLFFSSYELFMNKELQKKTGSLFVHEWLIYFMIDKTIQRWLSHNSSLESISILIPYCGSGAFTQLVIEYLLVQFKLLFPHESQEYLLNKIINHNIQSWDANDSALTICKNRIYNLFGVNPVLKNTTILLETNKFDVILGGLPRGNLLSNDFKIDISSTYNEISLDFINWSLKSIHENGEICFVVPEELADLINYTPWRKDLYYNLNLHRFVQVPKSATPSSSSLVLGLNHHQNYMIEYSSLIDFSEINISSEDFYNKNNNYIMKK